MMNLHLLALIPAYNESLKIGQVVHQTIGFLPVLVVDDGSQDGTALQAELAGANVLSQTQNQGKGAALKLGFNWALEHGYDAVLTLDADGQHDPLEIPGFMVAYHNDPAQLVIGQRDFSLMPFSRRIANTLGRLLFQWAVGMDILDNQSGYRLIRRQLLEKMVASSEQGFELEVEMIAVAVKESLGVSWVPISTIYQGEKSHIKPLAHIKNFIRVTRSVRTYMRRK